MGDTYYLPFKRYIQLHWPQELLDPPPLDQLDGIWIEPPKITHSPSFSYSSAILFERELAMTIPGLDGVKVVLAPAGMTTNTTFLLEYQSEPTPVLRFVDVPLALRVPKQHLQPARRVLGSGGQVERIEPDPDYEFVDITLATATLSIDLEGNIDLDTTAVLNLPLCLIGDTGIALEANNIRFYGRRDTPPAGKIAGWRGIHIPSASLFLPGELASVVGNLSISNAYIGNGGFTGSVSTTWSPVKTAQLGGVGVTLSSVTLGFVQNSLSAATIAGTLTLPFFEQAVPTEINIGLNGSFQIKVAQSTGLYNLTKPNVLDLQLNSIALKYEDRLLTTMISGTITPLFGGLDWPGFEVKELSIDSKGNVKLDGGWLNLRDQYSLSVSGFTVEITKIGFGKSDDGGKWVGFSGALQLVDGITAGASVEGLRVTWYDDGRSTKLSLNGVGVQFKVPGVLTFDGAVALRDLPEGRRFDGKVKILFECLDGLALDGQIVFGTHNGKKYYAIYLDASLPAGIPLASTGLALYGMSGLFANQMAPNKTPSQNWYDWYKQSPTGVTDLTSKWAYKDKGLAFGAGITVGTVSDNGYVFSGKLFFAIMFPGPIIMFEGKANILKERAALNGPEEPTFRALGVLDFVENSLFFGLDAQYKFDRSTGSLADIKGSAEVFFDWDDYNWHLYLGQRDPREKRIRASIFKGLFQADSYFMIDNRQIAMGARIGWGKSWRFGPLGVTLEAWIEGNARLSWKPGHFHGDLWLHGSAGLKVFRFGLSLTVDARISADVFNPYHLLGQFEVGIKLPWPFKKRLSAGVTLEWGPERKSPPLRLPLPLKEVAVEHLTVTTKWPLPRNQFLLPNYNDSGDYDGFLPPSLGPSGASVPANLNAIPVVPVDGRPHLTFSRPMHDDALVGINTSPPSPVEEVIGDPGANTGVARVRYGLKEVALERYSGGTWTAVAWAPNSANDSTRLYGSWAPVPPIATAPDGSSNAANVGQTKLWLWSKTPFNYTLATGERWDDWFSRAYPDYPCPPPQADRLIYCGFETLPRYQDLRSPTECPTHRIRMSWSNATARTDLTRWNATGIRFKPTTGQVGELIFRYTEPMDNFQMNFEGFDGVPADYSFLAYNAKNEQIASGTLTEAYAGMGIGIGLPNAVRFHFRFKQGFYLSGVYVTTRPDSTVLQNNDVISHINTQLAQWGRTDNVLEPNTIYRVRIKTQLDVRGEGPLAGYNTNPPVTEYAYFRTAGPPGVTTLSKPVDFPAGKEFVSGLEDLSGYVQATVPRSETLDGKPLLTRPVYRAYDVGVDFNVNYVDQMYRMARRDLQLYLYDNSNRPIRDAQGRIVVMPTQWGQADTVELNKAEERWTQALSSNGCITLPADFSTRSVRQGVKNTTAYVLDADRLYEGRLVPLLLREEFSGVASGTAATGPAGTLGAWRVVDKGTSSGPGRWQTGSAGTPAAFFITQTSGITGDGTLLTYTGDSTLPAADQPGVWSNYRMSAYVRLAVATGEAGLVVRYKDASNYYVFAIAQGTRRLLRVAAGAVTALATQTLTTAQALSKDYLLSVEVEGGRLRAYQDGALIFDLQDATVAQGGPGLYCASHAGARFTGVRVDDMRERAPVLFRFPFTTSRFVNFFHHLHSYAGQPWPLALAGDAPLTTAQAQAVAPAPVGDAGVPLAESQAYLAFAEAALTVAGERKAVQELEVTRVTYGGALRALLVRSPEPIDWRRTDLALTRTATQLPQPSAPRQAKLVGATFATGGQPSQESVQLLLTQPLALTGWRVEYRALSATTPNTAPWQTYYTFGAEERLADGTRLRISSGSSATPPAALQGVLERYVTASGTGTVRFPLAGVELRLVAPDGTVAHQHAFLPASAYTSAAVQILRKADGTGFVLLATSFPAGPHRLGLTFRRGDGAPKLSEAGNSGPEQVTLDII